MTTELAGLAAAVGLPWDLPPAAILFGAAALVATLRGTAQRLVLIASPLVGLLNLAYLAPGDHIVESALGVSLVLVHNDALAVLFGSVFHIVALIGALFALRLRDTVQHVAALAYVGSALGAAFAGDWLTLFVFWELLALSSAALIWAGRTPRAAGAAVRYVLMQIASGVLLLGGIAMLAVEDGSLRIAPLALDGPAPWLFLAAFGIKAAFPLVHNWLTDGYPAASPTGTVFLSACTTKVAILMLARTFAGAEPLIYIGTAMTVFPIFYAVIENDLRRVLAYSMINQLGFMVVGIGLGTALALNGAVSHAFNDVLFKSLLFMAMGAVLQRTGTTNGSELGGLAKSMPATTALCIIGAASISAFPLFSGFVSKSLVMSAALDEGYPTIWLLLLFASAGVFHHAGIKVPYFAFFAHDSGRRPEEAPWNMLAAMGLAAALCMLIGCYPSLLYGLLPYPVSYVPYTTGHVVAQLQLLLFSALAFVWLIRTGIYPQELPGVNLDAEWAYRWAVPHLVRTIAADVGGALATAWRRVGGLMPPRLATARGWQRLADA
ncbi:MAG: Na(+)/H(+) antiporter subunit D, partial [Alphaproteobacteria bacterium]|nr:Na(+)/H(+) antiporter subunit D [Alphaproteobacteria bacterium]